MYVKFDDPKAGSFLNDQKLRGELKKCVPITARGKTFPLKKGESTVFAECEFLSKPHFAILRIEKNHISFCTITDTCI